MKKSNEYRGLAILIKNSKRLKLNRSNILDLYGCIKYNFIQSYEFVGNLLQLKVFDKGSKMTFNPNAIKNLNQKDKELFVRFLLNFCCIDKVKEQLEVLHNNSKSELFPMKYESYINICKEYLDSSAKLLNYIYQNKKDMRDLIELSFVMEISQASDRLRTIRDKIATHQYDLQYYSNIFDKIIQDFVKDDKTSIEVISEMQVEDRDLFKTRYKFPRDLQINIYNNEGFDLKKDVIGIELGLKLENLIIDLFRELFLLNDTRAKINID
jgi:hypothetical protein